MYGGRLIVSFLGIFYNCVRETIYSERVPCWYADTPALRKRCMPTRTGQLPLDYVAVHVQ